jgi:hypothetical protein
MARFWAVAAAWVVCDAKPGRQPAADVAVTGRLARLGDALDVLGVGNADLARAVADAGPGVSLAARVLYGARQRVRATGLPAASSVAAVEGVRVEVPDLWEAQRYLRGWGLTVCMPSECVLAPDSVGRQSAVLYLLRAAAGRDREAYRRLLTGQQFGLEPAQAAFAAAWLLGAEAHTLPSRLRVSAEARELAALVHEAVVAIRSAAGRPDAMRVAVSCATRACGWTNQARPPLDIWAELADALWEGVDEARLPMSARLILFAHACEERMWSELSCVAEGTAPLWDSAGLSFADRCAPACDLTLLADALGLDEAVLGMAYRGRFEVHVTASLAEATAAAALADLSLRRRWSWPAPDMPDPILAPAMTFSASRLNTYAQCPRRWFYEYLCDVLPDPGSPAAAYGQAMHAALEAVHRDVRIPSRHDAADILLHLDGEIQQAFAQRRDAFPTPLEYAVSVARARRMAEQYVRWLAAEAARRPVEIVGVEVLQRVRFGDYEFVGFIDRIDRPLAGGPICIYDYKTGRIEGDAGAYLERVRQGAEAQLPLYYAMRAAAGERVGRVALVSLRDPKDEVWLLALDILREGERQEPPVDGVVSVQCHERDLESGLGALLERCDLLTKRGSERFGAGINPPCGHCLYKRSCRERPIDTERIFAR